MMMSRSRTIGRKLVERELTPRAFRHGKPIVMEKDFNPTEYGPGEVGVRKSNTLMVANGPTILHGLINGGSDSGSRASEPNWWKEEK
jgi:hypothetical protein